MSGAEEKMKKDIYTLFEKDGILNIDEANEQIDKIKRRPAKFKDQNNAIGVYARSLIASLSRSAVVNVKDDPPLYTQEHPFTLVKNENDMYDLCVGLKLPQVTPGEVRNPFESLFVLKLKDKTFVFPVKNPNPDQITFSVKGCVNAIKRFGGFSAYSDKKHFQREYPRGKPSDLKVGMENRTGFLRKGPDMEEFIGFDEGEPIGTNDMKGYLSDHYFFPGDAPSPFSIVRNEKDMYKICDVNCTQVTHSKVRYPFERKYCLTLQGDTFILDSSLAGARDAFMKFGAVECYTDNDHFQKEYPRGNPGDLDNNNMAKGFLRNEEFFRFEGERSRQDDIKGYLSNHYFFPGEKPPAPFQLVKDEDDLNDLIIYSKIIKFREVRPGDVRYPFRKYRCVSSKGKYYIIDDDFDMSKYPGAEPLFTKFGAVVVYCDKRHFQSQYPRGKPSDFNHENIIRGYLFKEQFYDVAIVGKPWSKDAIEGYLCNHYFFPGDPPKKGPKDPFKGPFHKDLWGISYSSYAKGDHDVMWNLSNGKLVMPERNKLFPPDGIPRVDVVSMFREHGRQFIDMDMETSNSDYSKFFGRVSLRIKDARVISNPHSEVGKPLFNRFFNQCNSRDDKLILVYHATKPEYLDNILEEGFKGVYTRCVYGRGIYVATLPLDASAYGRVIVVSALRLSESSLLKRTELPKGYFVVPNTNDLLPMFSFELEGTFPPQNCPLHRPTTKVGCLNRYCASTHGGKTRKR
jgi:hypothetical protein